MAFATVYLRQHQGKAVKEEIVRLPRYKEKIHIAFIMYVLRSAFYGLPLAFNDLFPELHSGLSGLGLKHK